MVRLSLEKPRNEPIINYKTDHVAWESLMGALQRLPVGFEVPLIVGGRKVFTSEKGLSIDPCDPKKVVCQYQKAGPTEALAAVEAALSARARWSTLDPYTRIQKFRDLENVLLSWRDTICAATLLECGYTANEISLSWSEIIDFVRFNCAFYEELLNEKLGDGLLQWPAQFETNQLNLRPLKGFTCAVTPFNFPIAIGYHLPLVMALLGNTVVWKPSDDAVFTSYFLMRALEEAGFPDGVVNFLTGDGPQCLPPVLQHPQLSALNFTGSFKTAKIFSNAIFSESYPRNNFPRFVAETGGKDFLVVDKHVDLSDVVPQLLLGAFGRAGQKCSATSVVFAHKAIWPDLEAALKDAVSKLVVDTPTNRNADLGPVINAVAFERLRSLLWGAHGDANCRLVAQGHLGASVMASGGYFIEPSLFEVLPNLHDLLAVEYFGPVSAIKTFGSLKDIPPLIEQHNYRLTGAVMSRDESFLEEAVPLLSEYAGNFYVNRRTTGALVGQQPFGGDGASGTNHKAGGKWYLLNFVSQGVVTRRHTRTWVKPPL